MAFAIQKHLFPIWKKESKTYPKRSRQSFSKNVQTPSALLETNAGLAENSHIQFTHPVAKYSMSHLCKARKPPNVQYHVDSAQMVQILSDWGVARTLGISQSSNQKPFTYGDKGIFVFPEGRGEGPFLGKSCAHANIFFFFSNSLSVSLRHLSLLAPLKSPMRALGFVFIARYRSLLKIREG